ncbi:uncharacterized protein CIMG_05420 [Coccidioides immitis RS]|uniref:Uncharacterized protein n=2 Tax=Coccidioides TaxID=5500 RepID=J3KFI7_COCIM|nr:uncharacterized protein CIMG_05420 [Coccidioides immitis RS]EAS34396.3 hypothetical protein CIMG_05420 [Coccidioides immitis RS]EFW17516.1 conserved hypothetical protein [Coccidioides posadasii str. Silveira]QVM05513.1 hypothetical protein D8B26_000220 [Coccidioides posadasii str. Silveira]
MHHFSWTTALAALLSLGSVEGSMSIMPLPQETPIGLMAAVGMSPKPTDPPGVPPGFPRELLPRKDKTTLPLPPPGYYCGLVTSDPDNLLTCVNARANCVHQGTAIGCCISSEITDCTNIPSSCINYGDECDASCRSNRRILKCTTTTEPYCGTYFFGGGSKLFGCRSYASVSSQVQQLTDYYESVYGSSWRTHLTSSSSSDFDLPSAPPEPTQTEESTPPAPDETSSSPAGPSQSTGPSESQDDDDDDDGTGRGKRKKSLSGGAIAGVVVGACAGVGAIAAFLVWFFCVKKKADQNNNGAAAAGAGVPPPGPPMAPHDQYGQPQNAAMGYYAPPPAVDNKPLDGSQPPPSYGYDKVPQTDMAEMPGNLQPPPPQQPMPPQGQANDYYNQRVSMGPPSPLSGSSPGSPNGMHPTHTGPVPEQIYEMGPGR